LKKYNINQSWFDDIDHEYKAYFLGFLWADGYINHKRKSIRLTLNDKDQNILKTFSNLLYNQDNIKYYIHKTKFGIVNTANLYIYNKHIYNKIIDFGYPLQNKTYDIRFPVNLNKSLYRHFIRGLFDGDGCIYVNKTNTRIVFDFTSNELMINDLKEILGDLKYFTYKRYKERNNNILSMRLNKTKEILNMLTWIYNDSTIFLERKFNKFNIFQKAL